MGHAAGDEFGRSFGDRASGQARQTGQRITSALTPSLSNIGKSFLNASGGAAKFVSSLVSVSGAASVAAGGLGVAVQGALALAAALAPASGALLALPAVVAGASGAFAVFKIAVGSFAEALGASLSQSSLKFQGLVLDMGATAQAVALEFDQHVTPTFLELRKVLTDRFTQDFVGDFERLSVVLGGPLQVGLGALAASIGRLADDVLEFVARASTAATLKAIWLDLSGAIDTVEPALTPLLEAFLKLSAVGGTFLSGFAPGVRDAVLRLAELTTRFVESGRALEALQNGFGVLGQLWQLLKDIGGIANAVFKAIRETGNDALGVIGNLVGGLRAFLESARGQEILISTFQALGRIGAALLPVVSALASGIGLLAPIIGRLAEIVGPILTTALIALGPALATVGGALVAVFQQLGVAVQILADSGALQAIAGALAALLVAVAPILPPLAQLIALLAQGLAFVITNFVAPALSTLIGWISQAVNWLTGASLSEDTWLSRVIRFIYDTVAPLFQQAYEIISRIFTDLVAWFTENQATVEEWGSKLQSIVSRVGDIIGGVFEFISIAWDTFGGPLLDIVGNVFTGILSVVDGVLRALSGLIEFVLGVITGDWERAWNGVKEFFGGIWDAVVSIFATIWENFKVQFKTALDLLGIDWESSWVQVKQTAERIWNAVVDWIKRRVDDVGRILDWFASLPGKFGDWFGRVKDAIVARFNEAISWISGIPNSITRIFANAGSWLYNAGREIVNGLWNGIVSLWNWVVSQWNNMVDGLIRTVKNILGIASPSRVFMEIGRYIGQGLANGITGTKRLVGNAVSGLADQVTSAWPVAELPLALDADRLNDSAAWGRSPAGLLPARTQPAGSTLVTAGASAERVYNVTLNAAPNIPSERQIVNALSYADALYA
ncbi:phage tail protein [Nonomuraea sp. CA-141351]|uniref:phage tail protein n=1 Tax=Nonomuraea sp. CA-141351 TaxID=3239996 RepID=UPI003D8B6F70